MNAALPVKPRRSHRKSRNGCRTCKGRHMKCDETRPICINCSVAGRTCEYKTDGPSRSHSPALRNLPNIPSPDSCVSNPSPPTESLAFKPSAAGVADEADTFTLEHLSLFHHAHELLDTAMIPQCSSSQPAKTVIQHALRTPYLMNELLAMSALHLAHCHPEQPNYLQQATALQTRGLSSFIKSKDDPPEISRLPRFMFSSLLGLHVLHDSLRKRPGNFSIFLDQFMEYMTLHRGVSTTTGNSWSTIRNSSLKASIMEVEDAFHNGRGFEEEVKILYDMVNQSHLDPSSLETYNKAISTLHSCLNLHHTLHQNITQPAGGPSTFCITVNKEYIELLKQRRPEALVILAFYATMLYQSRSFWMFADGGQYLIEAITAHLGSHWEHWLLWPNSLIGRNTIYRPGT
ncbi:uncharacterized protein BROUX77_007289 [Berkeleyomyces rouxiae]|uniref:uncharacterized protein n=1 Tax=Berkeleyomyces rouxiae TaxID=2035830 RepID=UPI003B7FD2C3